MGDGLPLEATNRFAADFLAAPLYLEHEGVAYSPTDPAGPAVAAALAHASAQVVKTACDVVVAKIRHVGVCNINVVTRKVNRELKSAATAEELAVAIKARYPSFEWIAPDWFWLGPGRVSTLIEWLVKMFLVSERPLSLWELKQGIVSGRFERNGKYRVRTYLLPDTILVSLLEKVPGVTQVSSRLFKFDPELYPGTLDVITWPEKLIVAYFLLSGSVVYRADLTRELVGSELLTENLLGNTLSISPLFQPKGDARWKCICATPPHRTEPESGADISPPPEQAASSDAA